jgi:hypothetical protein
MANIVRREERQPARAPSTDYRWDPFRTIDALFRPPLLAGDWAGLAQSSEFVPSFDIKETKMRLFSGRTCPA